MNGIFYFSSTGNSLYIAKEIQKALGGEVCYIPKYSGNAEKFEQIIIVSPVYSFGLPLHVFEFIPTLPKNVPLYIVLNYGGMVFGADGLTFEHAKKSGLDIKGVFTIKMTENYTLDFTVPLAYQKKALKKAPDLVAKVIAKIRNGEENAPKTKPKFADIYYKNKGNWHKIADDFSVTEDCILCKKCVELCPTENISVKEGKVEFSDKCVACLGCYHRCSEKAIVYKNKKKDYRYFNPNVNKSELGK